MVVSIKYIKTRLATFNLNILTAITGGEIYTLQCSEYDNKINKYRTI